LLWKSLISPILPEAPMRLSRLFLVIALALFLTTPAFAQRRGRAGRAGNANNTTGNDSTVSTGGTGAGGTGIPGSEANLATAREKRDQAKKDLDRIMAGKQKDFETSDEFTAAKKDLDDAIAAEKKAKEAALDKLKDDPAYKSAKDGEASAQKALDAAKADKTTSSDTRASLNDELFKKSGTVSRLEADAFKSDTDVQAAQDKSKAARDALDKLKTDNQKKLRTDPDVLAAQKTVNTEEASVAAWSARLEALKTQQANKTK
jgi:hypothetical protein